MRNYLTFIFFFTVLLIFNACSLPRIVVLDDPLTPEEHLNLGVAYERSGEPDNALREYEKASGKLPVGFLYMGNVYFGKQEYAKAEEYYRKAMKKDPSNADVCNNLAWLLLVKKEDLPEAQRLALKALQMNPGKKDIYEDTLEKIREAMKKE
jgi:Tfp pilus assembly protein PilF